MLNDTAESLQAHGFKNIIFIGDSGGNQAGQKAVAEALTAKWAGKALALHIPEYYDYAGVAKYMTAHGIVDGKSDNMHDDPIISLNMFNTNPDTIRYDARVKAGKASINGVSTGRQGEERGAGEADRRVPRDDDGGGDHQGDRAAAARRRAGSSSTATHEYQQEIRRSQTIFLLIF